MVAAGRLPRQLTSAPGPATLRDRCLCPARSPTWSSSSRAAARSSWSWWRAASWPRSSACRCTPGPASSASSWPGISLGNYLGGRIADRWPQRRTLGILLVAGGLASLAILPLINIATAIPTGELVDPSNRLGGVLPFDRAALLILRIVVITTLIFFPPSLILGMVSPVVIKLTLRDLAHSGGLVGKVYALSTLGSIVGTFATGFVLVQLFGTRMIVLGVGIVLLLMAAVFGDLLRVRRGGGAARGRAWCWSACSCRRATSRRTAVSTATPHRSDCVQRSVKDGWDQATSTGCLHETAYYCIKVAD